MASAQRSASASWSPGPVVAQGGLLRPHREPGRPDRRHARAGQVLVSQRVAAAVPPGGVVFTDAGEVELKGFAQPVRLLAAAKPG